MRLRDLRMLPYAGVLAQIDQVRDGRAPDVPPA
jgi:hypothetical protein